MRNLIMVCGICLSLSAWAGAAPSLPGVQALAVGNTTPVAMPQDCLAVSATHVVQPLATSAQRGCCSHHGGVCGCGGSTLRCCDGSNSPSCGC